MLATNGRDACGAPTTCANMEEKGPMSKPDDNLRLSDAEIAKAFTDPHWAERFPPILDVTQAADLMRISKGTVYDWSSRGLLRGCSRRVGKHLRIFRDRF